VTREVVVMAGATILAAVLASLVARGQDTAAFVVTFLYFEIGAYLLTRLVVPRLGARPADVTSYADGSSVTGSGLVTFDGGRVPLASAGRSANAKAAAGVAGDVTSPTKSGLEYAEDELRIDYRRDGSMSYATPDGSALFAAEGRMDVGDVRVARRDATLWLWLLALSGGLLAASKWNGLFDFAVVFLLVGAVALQNLWTPALRAMGLRVIPRPAKWGNPRGFSFDVIVAAMAFVGATVYVLSYIPYFSMGHNLADLVGMQKGMFGYHYDLHATHPYSSRWWQWPLLQIPISYYYKDFRTGAAMQNSAACCVAEILALPNPAVWWLGLLSVPYVAWLAWRERVKAYLLLTTAYLLQWLPWIASPRVAFEYHFYPNLAIICLADAILLQRVWNLASKDSPAFAGPRVAVAVYVAVVVLAFMFWHPVLAGTPVSWSDWNARMLGWLMGQLWINPHPGQ
jgi:hypothetical protein